MYVSHNALEQGTRTDVCFMHKIDINIDHVDSGGDSSGIKLSPKQPKKMEGNGGVNSFANDGSFMEMFRRKMEEERLHTEEKDCQNPAGETNRTKKDESGSLVNISSETRPNARKKSSSVDGQQSKQSVKKTSEEAVRSDPRTSSTKAAKDSLKCGNRTGSDSVTLTPHEQTTVNIDKKLCTSSAPIPKKYSVLSHVGKRRDGKLSLKTGAVKKPKIAETQETGANDAWSKYMAEVQKYKAHVCGDEDKSRPLVK